jgi:hypothetical protein
MNATMSKAGSASGIHDGGISEPAAIITLIVLVMVTTRELAA